MTTPEEIKAEYTSSLADLTFNSKPLINVLTMLAEENLPNAKIIVEAIEEHLAKVAVDVKLPILYLIDCIVKNVGRTYTGLFSQNIASTFCTVFKVVDEKTRSEMFKLRQTWNDVFPQMKLFAIDVQISQIDPAWPVTAQPNTIHFNPRFLMNSTTTNQANNNQNTEPTSAAPNTVPAVAALPTKTPPSADMETLRMQEQLIQKQKELLDLQRKTLELEVLQTQVKLQEQMKTGRRPPVNTNILLKPEVAKQLIPEVIGSKVRPSGISLRHQSTNQPKIKPVNPALASARPTRDPRLLRQQQQQQKLQQQAAQRPQVVSTTSSVLGEKAAVLESNKNVHNKSSVRDIPKDPRLSSRGDKKSKISLKSREQTADQKSSRGDDKHSGGSPKFNSSSGSSLSSSGGLDSPSKNKRSPSKNKKREKSRELESVSSSKKEKAQAAKEEDNGVKEGSSDVPGDIINKSVKGRNRNYVRRNLGDSPVQDQDLRLVGTKQSDKSVKAAEPAVAQPASPEATPPPVYSPISKPMDVDLRQLPPVATKKRPSTEGSEQPTKKSRSFDILFGSEDTDLRQMVVQADDVHKNTERPPTPPPPIISTEKESSKRTLPASPKKSDLDAVRAKLANATNRDKALSKSFHKNKLHQAAAADQDLRPKLPPNVTISPEEEKAIQSGHMTSEQGKQMLTKILSRIEKEKLREAQKKDHEESFGDTTLQEISDDELVPDEDNQNLRTFNDKDERLNVHPHHMETLPPGLDNRNVDQFYNNNRRPPFRSTRDNWRGRGRMAAAGPGPQPRQPIRPWLHQQPQQQQQSRWRGPYNAQQRPEFIQVDDESSRSPGQDHQELTIQQDAIKTLPIDGVPRDIRVYDDTAIIFMNYDDPREISFQNGARRVIFNNKESYLLTFGSGYSECRVNGIPFRVKLGAPSREIVINDIGFECFFGGPTIHITVSGVNMMVALEGPPPQVKIGEEKRMDLVAGKINLIVNATLMFPIFLDGKVQKFVLEGSVCTLKFIDSLKRVLINGVPYHVEFGGLPKPFVINEKKHFIRFSVLPKGVRPGFVKIKNMEGECGASPPRDEEPKEGFPGPLVAEPLRPEVGNVNRQDSPDNRSNSPSSLQPSLNNFDVLSNVISQSLVTAPTTGGYQVQLPGLAPMSAPQEPAKPLLNISELFQKLVASGFVKTQNNAQEEKQQPSPASNSNGSPATVHRQAPAKDKQAENSRPSKRTLTNVLRSVNFTRPESLKVRHTALYSTLYSGMQCSSCGMRFPLEASMRYSQHLDWHFRQNRRGKKNARVANSRKWYYSLADWKNYEELEDVEEREKNYFDQQQQAEVAEDGDEEVEIPTVPADPRTTDERCYVCRDSFEQFFNEDKEEWHLRNALRIDDRTYHPVCYEDHQKSILDGTLDESKTEETTQNKLIPGLEIVLDDDDEEADEIVSLVDDDEEVKVPEDAPSPAKEGEEEEETEHPPEDDGDDDDVILNEVAPIRIVVDDDDDDDVAMEEPSEPSVVKKEKQPAFDDGFMDVDEIVTLKDVGQVKIKSEPVDDDFRTLGNNTANGDDENQPSTNPDDQTASQSIPVTSHPQLITSIDGNIELSAPTAVPTTIAGGTKIKINISKPLPVITPRENSETGDSSDIIVKASEPPVEELEILRYKPALQNVPLKKLPPVKKGTELTGMCSLM